MLNIRKSVAVCITFVALGAISGGAVAAAPAGPDQGQAGHLEGHLPAEGFGQLDDGPGRHRRPVVADPEVIVSSGHGTFGAVTVTFEGIAGSASPAVAVKDRRRGRGNTGDGHGSSIWQGVAAGAVMSA